MLARLVFFVLVEYNWQGARIPCSLEKPVVMTIQMLMWRVLLPVLLAS